MPKENLLINETIQRIDFILRWMGIKLESRSPVENFKLEIRLFVNLFGTGLLMYPFILWCIIGAIKDGKMFTDYIRNIPFIITYFLAITKAILFYKKDNQVNDLMVNLKVLEKKENDRGSIDEIDEMIKSNVRFVTLVVKVHTFFNLSNMIFGLVYPLIATAQHYYESHEVKLSLLTYNYPFDASDIRIWPFIYVLQSWMVVVECLPLMGTDCLFYIFCIYIQIHFKSLKHDVEKVIPANFSKKIICQKEDLKSKLVVLVKRHQQIINMVDLLEEIYSKSFLLNYFISSILICIAGFNMMVFKGIFIGNPYLVRALLQIFLLCYFGNMLSTASAEISDAVFNSNWYLVDKSNVKTLMIIQTRAQKASTVTAFGCFDVNMPAFTSTVNTAWSYFNLLNTLTR